MLNPTAARELAPDPAEAVRRGGPPQWSAAHERLSGLDGRGWLLLDDTARSYAYPSGIPIDDPEWLAAPLDESSRLVAAAAPAQRRPDPRTCGAGARRGGSDRVRAAAARSGPRRDGPLRFPVLARHRGVPDLAPLHGPQRERLRAPASSADLTDRHRQLLAFHAGIRDDSGPRAGSLLAADPGATMSDTATTDIWPSVHVERAALAADLAGLTDEQWATPSLCGEYSVREVLAHLTAAATLGPLRWMWSVLRSRFDFDRHNADRLAEQLGTTPAETLTRFARITRSRTSTFGPKAAWLGEVVVHAEDIRRPLGIHHDYPVDVVTRVAEFYVGADFTVPSKSLTRGLRLEATDGPFAAGDGPLVRGATLALTMAMAGRGAYCDSLTGDGVAVLRARAGA